VKKVTQNCIMTRFVFSFILSKQKNQKKKTPQKKQTNKKRKKNIPTPILKKMLPDTHFF
jgi:hypothetical protein